EHPDHPYGHFSGAEVGSALEWLGRTVGPELLVGDGQRNFRLPTAVGALRPTALAQPSMVAGEPREGRSYVFVGLRRLKDFYPDLVAANLARQKTPSGEPITARAVHVDLQVREGEADTSGLNFARALDRPEVRQQLCALVAPLLEDGDIVGFPAVLGVEDLDAWRDIAARLGHDVFEVPLPPPSVPGMRLNERLTRLVKAHSRLIIGSRVLGYEAVDGHVESVTIKSAGHHRQLHAREFILATGGFESGALAMDSYGTVTETTFGLPLVGTEGEMVHADYWGTEQPLFRAGLDVDDAMRPLDEGGAPVFDNLHAAGGLLAGATRWREKSGDAIALVSALRAADTILGSK
ncbi:MAG: glycerol-3-phosphate dehydrogenase subunit GlpB, partial [Actinomyces sp.]|nr:glycerol-3-phosphate dehydrogenase subunit GlpB [Actinomyces sp.]